jgi:hypothetical protein
MKRIYDVTCISGFYIRALITSNYHTSTSGGIDGGHTAANAITETNELTSKGIDKLAEVAERVVRRKCCPIFWIIHCTSPSDDTANVAANVPSEIIIALLPRRPFLSAVHRREKSPAVVQI